MKKLLSLAFLLLLSFTTFGQVIQPARWSWAYSKPEVKTGETIDLVFTVTIDQGWHVYSSDFDPNVGPIVASIKLKPNDTFQLVGGLKSINAKKVHDEIFDGDVKYFEGKGEFRQTVKILKDKPLIEGTYDSQACQDDGSCVPIRGNFKLETALKVIPADANPKVGETVTPSKKTEEGNQQADSSGQLSKEDDKLSIAPAPVIEKKEPAEANESLWGFMLAAFVSGLLALLTPCVFPMIPMTVSYFTGKTHKSRAAGIGKALIYGVSIVAIYTLIGTIVSRINGPAFANFVSTHWVPNILFFLIFVFFGLSFLGWFEIVLPHWLVNKVDAQADRGGLAGIFFMAFTIVLVSFSCTGPIVGSILVASAGGQVVKPILGMVSFSMAFAVPFALFAVFPQWLKSLPKSGGWLNTVKVVLGFLELALALKFLSIADQVYHWRILDREVYLAFWIVIFALIGFYLLGKIRTPHDDKVETISVPRMILAICTLSFVVYMIPGLFGAPLKVLSGYLPPLTTQDFVGTASAGSSTQKTGDAIENPKYADLFTLPHNLKGFFEYKEALAYAKKVNKPIFIDFTGHGCVNCRKMEEYVWSQPEVLKRLQNDFIVVALYVDDKTELPQTEWYSSTYDNQQKMSIGDQNADFQIVKYNNNAQPYYCLVDHDGKLLQKPQSYTSDVNAFVQFLDAGKSKFQGI